MGIIYIVVIRAIPFDFVTLGVNNMTQQNAKKIRTSNLLQRLFKASDLETFIEKNEAAMQTPSFHEYVSELCKEMELVPERVIRQSSIERSYGHQLFNGTRKPSRDKVIQLAFGFGLDVEGTQELLSIAHKSSLYPRIRRDAAILYCISHHMDIVEVQNVLQDLNLTLLGDE